MGIPWVLRLSLLLVGQLLAVTDSLRTDHTGFATPESMSSPTNKRVLQLFMLRRSAVCNNFALVREGM